MRKLFIKELLKSSKNKKNYLLINDLGYNVIEPFKKKYPDRIFNAGVDELILIEVLRPAYKKELVQEFKNFN